MDFSCTEAQDELAGLTGRIVRDRVTHTSLSPHGSGGFDQSLWTDLRKAGVLDAALPAAVGGGGFGLLEQCSVLIELGRGLAPVPYLAAITMSASALAEYATGEQLERWAIPMLRGDRLLTAAVPDAHAACAFTAQPDGDGWRLSGAQTAVLDASFADSVLVAASAPAGSALFAVDKADPGVTVEDQATTDRADAGLVTVSDLWVDTGRLIGQPGSGVVEWLQSRGTVGLCAWQLGITEQALRLTAEYAKERTQFDHALSGFQAVRQRLADAYIDVEAVRLSLWQAAWRLAEGLPASEEVATAKFWAAEAGHRVAHTAVHIHGGVGIDVDHPVHRYFTAAKRGEFTLGGANAQLLRLGELFAMEPA